MLAPPLFCQSSFGRVQPSIIKEAQQLCSHIAVYGNRCIGSVTSCSVQELHEFIGLQEIQRLQDDADKANKQASLLERENQRLDIQVKDLSQQVSF